jgi:hypothetical protein
MSTKTLDYHQFVELQPAHSLWRSYTPAQAPQRFTTCNPQEAELWQDSVRQALFQQIGFQDLADAPCDPQLIEEVDKGDYVRQKILLRTGLDMLMPVYLLIPKNRRPTRNGLFHRRPPDQRRPRSRFPQRKVGAPGELP